MLLLSDRRGGANNKMGKDMKETNHQRRNPKGQKTFEKCSAYWC